MDVDRTMRPDGASVALRSLTTSAAIRQPEPTATGTRTLLAAGLVAGPLFLAVGLIHAFTREGFDLGRHPLSLLSLGDLGWIQIANFVVTGALYVACAVGLRRALHPGKASTWGPVLVGGLGVGLILAGVFVSDPGAGFPPGAPAGAPERTSWHGILHGVGAVVSFNGMIVGCLMFARRFRGLGERGWMLASIATAASVLVVTAWPDTDSISVRLVVGSAILFAFVGALSARTMRDLPAGGSS